MIICSLVDPKHFEIADDSAKTTFFGCDQEWYSNEWQRRAGCGPTTACNIYYYMMRDKSNTLLNSKAVTKKNGLSLMEEIWNFVTPSNKGMPLIKMFYQGFAAYTNSKNLNVTYKYYNVHKNKLNSTKMNEILGFIKEGLSQDTPVAFLNLCNGEVKNLDGWHWVTIISLEHSENYETAYINIIDEGLIKRINLSLWYNTTKLGGGFVYFIFNTVPEETMNKSLK